MIFLMLFFGKGGTILLRKFTIWDSTYGTKLSDFDLRGSHSTFQDVCQHFLYICGGCLSNCNTNFGLEANRL